MRLLLLGGGWFLGRTLAVDALARGWHVTSFTRGRSVWPPPGVEHVKGDRGSASDLERLAHFGPWDATIDTIAREPGEIRLVLDKLGGRAGRYVLISTVSVYRDWPSQPVSEDSPTWPARLNASKHEADIAALPGPFRYGTLKAGAELAARMAPGGSLIVRPSVILGPGEYVGRMLSLLGRAARGGDWLLPGPAHQAIQPVDVRDVAAFVLDRLVAADGGLYNLTAPAGFATYAQLIDACIAVTGGRTRPVWCDPGWLAEQGVAQWTEIPLWRMPSGTWAVDSRRALAAGFTCRPLATTVADTWRQLEKQPPVPNPRQPEHGMDVDKEKRLLRLWAERSVAGR